MNEEIITIKHGVEEVLHVLNNFITYLHDYVTIGEEMKFDESSKTGKFNRYVYSGYVLGFLTGMLYSLFV